MLPGRMLLEAVDSPSFIFDPRARFLMKIRAGLLREISPLTARRVVQ